MKREIKIRAFNPISKRMFLWNEIENFWNFEDISRINNGSLSTILMQFTGLKDKNGVNIYEGDILDFPFEMGIAYVINDGFRFAVKSPGSEAVDYENEDVFESSIIIGNIYENPELIKP